MKSVIWVRRRRSKILAKLGVADIGRYPIYHLLWSESSEIVCSIWPSLFFVINKKPESFHCKIKTWLNVLLFLAFQVYSHIYGSWNWLILFFFNFRFPFQVCNLFEGIEKHLVFFTDRRWKLVFYRSFPTPPEDVFFSWIKFVSLFSSEVCSICISPAIFFLRFFLFDALYFSSFKTKTYNRYSPDRIKWLSSFFEPYVLLVCKYAIQRNCWADVNSLCVGRS